MKNKKSLLVTLADKNFIEYAKQLFSSAYWNAGWKGDYMLLSHEIPEKELEWFFNKSIWIKRCSPLYNKEIGREKYSPAVLDKFYLFTPEFQKWDNVVFLDADIIIRASIDELAKVNGFASPNVMGDRLRLFFQKNPDPSCYKALKEKYNLRSLAFNSGVMAFSTEIIKKDTFDNLKELFIYYQAIASSDDPILNLFFYKNWKKLPVVYDITPLLIEKKTGINTKNLKGIIIHLKNDELHDKSLPFNSEWKKNLEKAENIDLKKIQKTWKWNVYDIKYYSMLLNIRRLMHFLHEKSGFLYRYRLIPLLNNIKNTPDRILGKAGEFIRKYNPGLYQKLRKIKGGK